jgi:hypothetical protein
MCHDRFLQWRIRALMVDGSAFTFLSVVLRLLGRTTDSFLQSNAKHIAGLQSA